MKIVPWHLLAAAIFIVRMPLTAQLLSSSIRSDTSMLLVIAAIHVAIAIGYVMRHPIAVWFGLYAAGFSLVTSFLYSDVLGSATGGFPWLAVNIVFSVILIAVTFAAWRQMRAAAA